MHFPELVQSLMTFIFDIYIVANWNQHSINFVAIIEPKSHHYLFFKYYQNIISN